MIDSLLEQDARCRCGEWVNLTPGGTGECYECTFGEREPVTSHNPTCDTCGEPAVIKGACEDHADEEGIA